MAVTSWGLMGGAALAEPPEAHRTIAQQGIPIDLQKPRQKVDVSPQATGQWRQSPGGSSSGTAEPQRNATPPGTPPSPTPPGFPFGPTRPDQEINGGPPASGPQPDTMSIPK